MSEQNFKNLATLQDFAMPWQIKSNRDATWSNVLAFVADAERINLYKIHCDCDMNRVYIHEKLNL